MFSWIIKLWLSLEVVVYSVDLVCWLAYANDRLPVLGKIFPSKDPNILIWLVRVRLQQQHLVFAPLLQQIHTTLFRFHHRVFDKFKNRQHLPVLTSQESVYRVFGTSLFVHVQIQPAASGKPRVVGRHAENLQGRFYPICICLYHLRLVEGRWRQFDREFMFFFVWKIPKSWQLIDLWPNCRTVQ